ncbi:MAG TPA: TrmH family RNA methyltransferase, partial [Agromyces sp.]|nr:TrmH family RNA methyltransferase [Agromyces sp.]
MRIERVRDAASDEVADYARLTDVALRSVHEPAEGLYIAESAKVIRRAIGAGHLPRSVLMEEKWLAGLEESLAPFDIPVHLADPDQLEAITGYRVHRGALAAFHRPELPDPAVLLAHARRVVVLEDIVDHTNVGAIFRSVAALGADAVFVSPRCADPL